MQEYPKRPTGNYRQDIQELYSYLFKLADKMNREQKALTIGNTTLSEEELKKLKKLIGGK